MTTTLFNRPARRVGPKMPEGELALQEPPPVPESKSNSLSTILTYLPMVLMSGSMTLTFLQRPGPMTYVAGGVMVVGMVGMVVSQLIRAASERKHKMGGDRRDYLRYLSQQRQKVRRSLGEQQSSAAWTHPHPGSLWSLALSYRLWERRGSHEDFGEVRIGVGPQHAALKLAPPETKPVEDLEPLSAHGLRRFLRAYSSLPAAPVPVYVRGLARIQLRGHADATRAMTRAMVAQLATFHSPDDVVVAVCAGDRERPAWDWVKWLPHAQDAQRRDGAGPVRLMADNVTEVEDLLGEDFTERPKFEGASPVTAREPLVVVVLDGVTVPSGHRFAGEGYRNTVVIDVGDGLPWRPERDTLHLDVVADELSTVTFNRAGKESANRLGIPDALGVEAAAALARTLSPFRIGAATDTSEPLATDYELTTLLGIGDAHGFDRDELRRERPARQRLRVPIGIDTSGVPIELDIKESAEDGMGPHGMLIGATGSGKSELLRTLVLGLAVTHSSEELNFVLVDFKGGAAFLGFDRLPHTSAVITNLVDEIELVDRMQDALTGEMNRRQELLRSAGNYASRREYEKARRGGAPLEPMPALFVVVDEFSEMLVSKPEFIDVFAMIGRLGRSLGVHLLLASQRLDEGRISKVETHLSYRIGLRTFSAMESRSVIGVPDAYELPSNPGNGYLRSDTQTLNRFKAAYVSGPYRAPRRRASQQVVAEQLVEFTGEHVVQRQLDVEEPVVARPQTEEERLTTMDVIINRLAGHGAAARQVWLPPLREPAALDNLLPALQEDPELGLHAPERDPARTLVVPVGLVDLPAQQRRELLTADLSGAEGHVAIVGAPQSGKSTLLRTLICAAALTHTSAEVQFYCLDFSGGSLAALAGLPHVGSVANRLDRDRITRTVQEITNLLQRREQLFASHNLDSMAAYRRARAQGRFVDEDPYGDVFLVVDGWYTVRSEFDELETRFQDIAARGLSFGIHLVVCSGRWSDMRPWLRDVLGTRFELRLGDPVESEVNGRLAATVPAAPGRGITAGRQHFLAALPRIDGQASTEDLADAVSELVQSVGGPGAVPAPPVRLLPPEVPAQRMPEIRVAHENAVFQVPLGLDDVELEPLWHDFDQTPHLVVFGDTESGKTNMLRYLAEAVTRRYSPEQARVLFADPRRELHDALPAEYQVGYSVTGDSLAKQVAEAAEMLASRVPGPEISPDRLSKRDWWTGGRLFIVVDDAELVESGFTSPLQPLISLLPQGHDIGLHLIVARSTSGGGRAMMDPVLRRLWELGTPVLLFSCPKDEGNFVGNLRPRQLPPGRAQFVNRRRVVRLVQTPLLDGDRSGNAPVAGSARSS
ncbi:type VII secretion protein EccCa [Saccharopolyspora shandongensis]|uniref:type VII secretion protein EccCa n=1 Tax=Saccharopolyspora shandongensis TaxID=418495 RepID=UPI0033E6A91D